MSCRLSHLFRAPFSFYGGMSENSRGLLGVGWGCSLARGRGTFCGRWREWIVWCGKLSRSLYMLHPRFVCNGPPVAASLWKLVLCRMWCWGCSSRLFRPGNLLSRSLSCCLCLYCKGSETICIQRRLWTIGMFLILQPTNWRRNNRITLTHHETASLASITAREYYSLPLLSLSVSLLPTATYKR